MSGLGAFPLRLRGRVREGFGRAPWAAVMLLLTLGTGAAQERPAITPTRDVDVIYRVPQPNAAAASRALEQRMRYTAASRRQRVDPPTPGLYVIMDFAAHRMSTVRPGERMALDMPTPADAGASIASFTRKGEARVAGVDCTIWLTQDAVGAATEVCFTSDGVMLRAAGAGRLLLEATSVRYETQDAALFVVPGGFKHITAPAR